MRIQQRIFSAPWAIRFSIMFGLCFLFLSHANAQQKGKQKIAVEVKDSAGMLKEKGYKNAAGQRSGMWTYYDNAGKVSRKVKYRNDTAVWTFIYENGNVTESINRKGKVRKRTCNCPN